MEGGGAEHDSLVVDGHCSHLVGEGNFRPVAMERVGSDQVGHSKDADIKVERGPGVGQGQFVGEVGGAVEVGRSGRVAFGEGPGQGFAVDPHAGEVENRSHPELLESAGHGRHPVAGCLSLQHPWAEDGRVTRSDPVVEILPSEV